MERLFRVEDILEYIEEQKKSNASSTRQLSIYYEATQKKLAVNEQSLQIWLGYIDQLERNGYGHKEIREVYKMLKAKYWKFFFFWREWFNYESRLPYNHSKKAKVLESLMDILRYKECADKEAMTAWAQDLAVQNNDSNNSATFFSPETPRSISSSQGISIVEKINNEQHPNIGTVTMSGSVFDAPPDTKETRETERDEVMQSVAQSYKKITLNGKRFRILRAIGKGGSSKVYQVLSEKNELFALKRIKLVSNRSSEEIHASYVNEIALLKRLKNHHEIVTLKDSYVNRDRIAILMEYGDIDLCKFLEIERSRIPGGYRKNQENYTMVSLWEQMLRAVKCIHSHRIVHRDLKPANFLFVNGRLKLIDFGISREIKNDTTNIIREKQIGTINYMSPEAIIEGKTKMGRSSDIWSLGCILYEMYFGESPFMRFKNLVQRMQKLLDTSYEIEYPPEEPTDNRYSEVVQEIRKCLVRDPRSREKIDTLLEMGLCSRPQNPDESLCVFNKEQLSMFISKIMEMKHTAPTEEIKSRIIEKISSLYIKKPHPEDFL